MPLSFMIRASARMVSGAFTDGPSMKFMDESVRDATSGLRSPVRRRTSARFSRSDQARPLVLTAIGRSGATSRTREMMSA